MTGSVDDLGRDLVVVDARGLRCPLPVIRLAERARDTELQTVIEVWATDPAARADIPAWCRMRGQEYLGAHDVQESENSNDIARGSDDAAGAHTAYRIRVVT